MLQHRFACCLLALSLICLTPAVLAADDPAPEATAPEATVADLGWITGQWRGEMDDSVIDEQWSATGGGAMMGMFRWFTETEIRLYEFMLIEPSPQGPVLRIKHFGSGLRGWEEKDERVEFHLVEHQDGLAVFERDPEIEASQLIYRHTEEDRLEVQLIKTKDGKKNTSTFLFERQ